MNSKGKMSFRDFIFPINPQIIRIRNENNLSSELTAGGGASISCNGEKPAVISGSGQFTGDDCVQTFERLRAEMNRGGMLYIPAGKPVFAYLRALELICEDVEGAVRYSFEFVKGIADKCCGEKRVIYGDDESCLWDYSYRYDIPVTVLMRLNTHIRRPDIRIKRNERIYLC